MRKVKIISALIFILTTATLSMAQRLPDVQQTSVTTTTPLKVDGKLTEPDFNFSAFNKNTRLFYTMMNDNNHLYLVIKADETDNTRKILMGGITLSFNSSGKKKEKDAASITFPVIAVPIKGPIRRGQATFEHRMGGPETNRNKSDSATIEMKRKQLASFNEIKVSGIDIPDTLLSIYNIYGIKAAINYNESGNLIYEFSIPLKLLNLDIDKPKEFAYNIKVNGRPLPPPSSASRNEEYGVSGGGSPGQGMGQRVMVINGAGIDPSMLEPTDFWGKYTATKQ